MTPNQEPTFRRKVLSSFAWMGSAQFFGQLVTWASTILVIRLLEPSDYGLRAMATVFLSFLLMVADLGIGAAIVQAKKVDDEDARHIQAFIICVNFVGFALTLLGSHLVAAFFEEPRLTPLLYALSSCFVLMSLYILPQSMLERELKFKRKAHVDFASMTGGAVVSLGGAILGFGVWSLIAGTIAIHVVRAIGFNIAHRGIPLPRWSLGPATRFVRFGSVVIIDRILWFFYSQLDVIIAGKILGKELVGFYAVALTLSALPIAKVMPILNQVSFSAFSRIQHDRERVRENVLRAVHYGFAIFLPVLWGMALVAPDGIPLVLGENWGQLVIPFQLIAIILPLKAVATLLPPALFAIGRPGVSAVNMGITTAIMAVAFFVGAQSGLNGLGMAWLIAYPIAFVIIAIRALPVLDVSLSNFWLRVRGVFGAGATMVGVVLLVQFGASEWTPLLRLLASASSGALAYVAVMRVVDRAAIIDLRRLLAN